MRGFGFYQTILSIILLVVCIIVSIVQSDQNSSALFGIILIYLVSISECFQYYLMQILMVESMMVSAQRILRFLTLPHEKSLRTDYDCEIGLRAEVEA
jgi:hypothetical protein